MKMIIYDYWDGVKTIPADILQGVIDIIDRNLAEEVKRLHRLGCYLGIKL